MTINNKGSEDAGAVPATSTIRMHMKPKLIRHLFDCKESNKRFSLYEYDGKISVMHERLYDGGELGSTGT